MLKLVPYFQPCKRKRKKKGGRKPLWNKIK